MWKPPSPTASVLGYASTRKQLKVNITSRGGGGGWGGGGREISFEKWFFKNIFATDCSLHAVEYKWQSGSVLMFFSYCSRKG